MKKNKKSYHGKHWLSHEIRKLLTKQHKQQQQLKTKKRPCSWKKEKKEKEDRFYVHQSQPVITIIIIFNIMEKHRRVQVDLNMVREIKVTGVVKYVQIKG